MILAAAHHAAHISNAPGWAIIIGIGVLAVWAVGRRMRGR